MSGLVQEGIDQVKDASLQSVVLTLAAVVILMNTLTLALVKAQREEVDKKSNPTS